VAEPLSADKRHFSLARLTDGYRVTPLEGEKPALGVKRVAAILRTTPSALRRAIKNADFPMPPASPRPLRWTEGQIERLIWAPQDHNEHLQKTQRRYRAPLNDFFQRA
jgi:hypothetical protein